MISTSQSVRNKMAFSLFELIVVILIISIVYFFTLSNISLNSFNQNNNLTITNLKQFLTQNHTLEDNLIFFCEKDSNECALVRNKQLIKTFEKKELFEQSPIAYKYNRFERINYADIHLSDGTIRKIDFKIEFDNNHQHNEFIVSANDKHYLFTNLFSKPLIYKSMKDYYDNYKKNKRDVINAF